MVFDFGRGGDGGEYAIYVVVLWWDEIGGEVL